MTASHKGISSTQKRLNVRILINFLLQFWWLRVVHIIFWRSKELTWLGGKKSILQLWRVWSLHFFLCLNTWFVSYNVIFLHRILQHIGSGRFLFILHSIFTLRWLSYILNISQICRRIHKIIYIFPESVGPSWWFLAI